MRIAVSPEFAAPPSLDRPALIDTGVWTWARDRRFLTASGVAHRGIPPTDLLIAAAAESAGVELVHYDCDYERIAGVTALDARWLVPDGTLA